MILCSLLIGPKGADLPVDVSARMINCHLGKPPALPGDK